MTNAFLRPRPKYPIPILAWALRTHKVTRLEGPAMAKPGPLRFAPSHPVARDGDVYSAQLHERVQLPTHTSSVCRMFPHSHNMDAVDMHIHSRREATFRQTYYFHAMVPSPQGRNHTVRACAGYATWGGMVVFAAQDACLSVPGLALLAHRAQAGEQAGRDDRRCAISLAAYGGGRTFDVRGTLRGTSSVR